MGKDTEHYEMFKLKNREFSVDVDVKSLTCGMNGALYFVAMDADGGKGLNNNEAGAKFGTGYCDAQCPHDIKWFGGTANVDGAMGSCCTELDIWEANREARPSRRILARSRAPTRAPASTAATAP